MESRVRAGRARKAERIRRRKKTISAVVLLFVLMTAILVSLLFIPFFNISSVTCIGTSVLNEELVIDASGLATGINIFRISVHQIEENVKTALPYVADVVVHRSFPASVQLKVTERAPVAYVQNGASYLVIDAQGVALEQTDLPNSRGVLPLVPELKLDTQKPLRLGERIAVTDNYRFRELLDCIKVIFEKPNLKGRVTQLMVNDLMQYEMMIENRVLAIIPVDSVLDYQLDFMLAALAQQSPTIEGVIDLTIEGKAAFRPKTQEVIHLPDEDEEVNPSEKTETTAEPSEEPIEDVQE